MALYSIYYIEGHGCSYYAKTASLCMYLSTVGRLDSSQDNTVGLDLLANHSISIPLLILLVIDSNCSSNVEITTVNHESNRFQSCLQTTHSAHNTKLATIDQITILLFKSRLLPLLLFSTIDGNYQPQHYRCNR